MHTPYQKHSETSRESAEKLSTADSLRSSILEVISSRFNLGMTGDELSINFSIAPGTISARLIELERSGKIIKTKMRRLTQAKRNAFVYVAAQHWHEHMGKAPTPESTTRKNLPSTEKSGLQIFDDVFYRNPHLKNTFTINEIAAIRADLEKAAK